MQTYYVTVCREYGTVQEEAILKSAHLADQVAVAKAWGEKLAELEADHLAALAEKDKKIAGRDRVINTLKEDKVFLSEQIAVLTAERDTLKEEIDRLKRQVVVGNFNPHGRMVCRDGEAD